MVQATQASEQQKERGQRCPGEPKWAAVIDDVLVPMPQREVPVSVLRAQAGVPDEFVLIRDHNSPEDVVLDDEAVIDLGEGNVFYRIARCDVIPRRDCTAPAKLAFVVNDQFELSTIPRQTGESIRGLFSLGRDESLLRDTETPEDAGIEPEDAVLFSDGPVFITRTLEAGLRITVNFRPFTEADGVKPEMTGLAIAALVYPEAPRNTVVRLQTPSGDREIAHDETIHIRGCEAFDVTRCDVVGGYEASRVEREVAELRENGAEVTLVWKPTPAVIYHGLRTWPGYEPAHEDVLVPVPGGYPGQMLDGAYLPENSPLIGHVEGSPQDHRITALERQWRQISYHPHNGGGGPKWNPTVHGFHTYAGELLSWLHKTK